MSLNSLRFLLTSSKTKFHHLTSLGRGLALAIILTILPLCKTHRDLSSHLVASEFLVLKAAQLGINHLLLKSRAFRSLALGANMS
ncbi:unnamed protein product [Blepharisma stoltei]|uniref:Uncharacterized protein n=1 Tax=Blepharisma stoltei TaxID=1481888 RepID=A0AAU9JGV5_9CILI|nr:unnamed protein product [Blepharisma stoltei]